jgi:hypothetical protein
MPTDIPKTWTKQDIMRLWPQAHGELSSLQRHLEHKSGLTAAQLGMALQLASERFEQLRSEP